MLAAVALAVPVLATPVLVSAQDTAGIGDCLSSGANLTVNGNGACTPGDNTAGTTRINTIITQVVRIFSAIVGVVSIIMIIYGGFKYISSGGDSSKVTEAKNTIIYAIIGLAVVALAQFIVKFVLDKVTGQN